jgi:hypothetical protein
MQTIFKDLENLKIPYIIGVAKSKLKNAYDSKENWGCDYFIAIPFDTNELILENLGFNIKQNQNHLQCMEYDLDNYEIDIFKQNLHNYKMVQNNKFGMIYEPLHVSLKQYFNNNNTTKN